MRRKLLHTIAIFFALVLTGCGFGEDTSQSPTYSLPDSMYGYVLVLEYSDAEVAYFFNAGDYSVNGQRQGYFNFSYQMDRV